MYVDNMLIASKNMEEINRLKAQLSRMFDMKDLGAEKHILGMEIHRDKKMEIFGYHNRSMWKEYFESWYEQCKTC